MKTIIQRELLDNFKSLRFVVLLIFSIVLFSLNGFLFVQRITQQIYSYNDKINRGMRKSTVRTWCYKRPSPMIFLAEGGEKYLPNGYSLMPKGAIEPFSSSDYNYKMPDTPELDWAFIIKVIFSLYVLLLGYDTVSGEKEQGTLRLILSNPLNRIQLLVAKYFSMLITVLIPLLFGMLISLIIVGISIPQILSFSAFTNFFIMSIIAFVYISLFIFMSLLISSLIHQSSLVLLALLSIWLVLLIIPEMSFVLSQKLSKIPGEYQITRQINSREHNIIDYVEFKRRLNTGEFATEEEVKEEGSRLLGNLVSDLTKLYIDYQNSMEEQRNNARLFSRLSPMAIFQYAAENTTGTGLKQQKHFISDIKAFSQVYDGYILDKVGKLVDYSKYSRGWTVEYKGKWLEIDSPRPEEYNGDMSDFPVFVPLKPSIVRTVNDLLLDMSILLIWNIVLALGAFIAFFRADVR
ncbi:MAG: ABC transporter permease subunit [Candidatus Latescibacteria bacterium]|jgi:ABC-type transport system involved in multi-copper enzyme maturation permease subunit|nr:ABC transporter permease subunit [Candidatus Latescibacterota bacterium]